VTIAAVQGNTVSVRLVATQTDYTQHTYSGRYTVTGSVVTRSQIQQIS
jgi:hypothetical protein